MLWTPRQTTAQLSATKHHLLFQTISIKAHSHTFEREFNQLECKPELMLLSNEKNSTYWSEIHRWRPFINDGIKLRAKETDLRPGRTVRQVLIISSHIRGWHKGKKDSCRCELGSELQAGGGYWTITQCQHQSYHVWDGSCLTSSLPFWRRTSVCFCLCRWHLCDYEHEVCCDMVSVCRGPF